MIFSTLASAAFTYTTLTPETFERAIKGPYPVLVRFHTAHRKYSLSLDEQYDFVGSMFQGIDGIKIAAVNCGKYRTFCYNQGVSQCPVVRLYTQKGVYDYDGGFSHESISRWVTGIVGVHPRDLVFALRSPNTRVFKELINNTHCVFVMFYNPWNVPGKKFLPHMREVAEAFKYDPRVEFVAADTDLYKFYTWDFDLTFLPEIRLYCKDESEPIKYTGRRTSEDLIDFINDYCGTQRGLNGRLNSEAGVIDEVSQIVEDFLTKGKRPQYIKDMEDVEGTQYYVWVMNQVIKEGDEFINKEKNRLNEMLDAGVVSPEKLDEFQIRVNILSVFASYLE